MRDFTAFFCCMPGVRIKMGSFGWPAAAVLVHPEMRPAVLNLETGELREFDFEPVAGERTASYL